ncbi:uncharacterized protein LOC114325162 [Diabrotica virgifera virgifera]|uniref:Uncharacterized protein n=1 Tax=Diabrotica virgifera virgifera TaxID=50390 RepID=A0ABM5K794_DIAVI|nr:uncharacterized protein LOC114325162 [Diabrotica virgifera virgifera]
MHVLVIATILLAIEANSIPVTKSDDEAFKFPITFENGRIGVNFLGFHASAGLGGLLTGNSADGGLHAEAGTPFGQRAWAGLGGDINGAGRSGGGLYAGATALNGLGAVAGLDGNAGPEGYNGRLYSGTSRRGLRVKQRIIGQGLPPPDEQTVVQEDSKFPENQVPGRSGGGLYAGASLPGIGAVAGLDGYAGPEGYNGRVYPGLSRKELRKRQRLIKQGLLPPNVQTYVLEENKFPEEQVPDTYIMKVKKTNGQKQSSKKIKEKETSIEVAGVDDGKKDDKIESKTENDKIPESKNTEEKSKLPVYDLDLRSL